MSPDPAGGVLRAKTGEVLIGAGTEPKSPATSPESWSNVTAGWEIMADKWAGVR